MITKEEFIGLISSHIEWLDKIEQVSKILGINIWDSSCIDYTSLLFEKVVSLAFQESEVDTIYWWMFVWNCTVYCQQFSTDRNSVYYSW